MLHGILDPQPGRLAFALFDDDKLLRQDFQQMHPRDASQVPQFVIDNLAACGKTLLDVSRWTFGCGPGSFTFLRVVAALGAGWAAANPAIRFRCVPGALALAAKLDLNCGESAGILYDGRNKELLCFGVRRTENGTLEPTGEELILNAEAAGKFFTENPMKLAAFACDEAVLNNLLGNRIPFQTVEPDPAALANAPGEFDNDTDKMCYIRPAVTGK
jgi:tRNA A37 threonylcarbamoyladenosine modification protein TsaB